MGKIHKITKNGQTIYPATTTDAVAHPTLKVPVSKLIGEINVSNLFPTGGTNGTNKYTLESAIAKIPTDLRVVGIKCSFLDDTRDTESWEYLGGTFTSTASWRECGGRKFTELESKAAGINYVTCDTAASQAAKTVTVPGLTSLTTGIRLLIKMANNNTAGNATLNINSLGAKPIYYNNVRVHTDNAWNADEVIDVYYDGTIFNSSNFQGGSSEDGSLILEWNTDAATTRKQVKSNNRKIGLKICYNHPVKGWVNEQYIGPLLTDVFWGNDNAWLSLCDNRTNYAIRFTEEELVNEQINLTTGYTTVYDNVKKGDAFRVIYKSDVVGRKHVILWESTNHSGKYQFCSVDGKCDSVDSVFIANMDSNDLAVYTDTDIENVNIVVYKIKSEEINDIRDKINNIYENIADLQNEVYNTGYIESQLDKKTTSLKSGNNKIYNKIVKGNTYHVIIDNLQNVSVSQLTLFKEDGTYEFVSEVFNNINSIDYIFTAPISCNNLSIYLKEAKENVSIEILLVESINDKIKELENKFESRITYATEEFFSVEVDGNFLNTIDDYSNDEVISNDKLWHDWCHIVMPETTVDNPAKLILLCHGQGLGVYENKDEWYNYANMGKILTSLGYAVLCCNFLPKEAESELGVSYAYSCGNWMIPMIAKKAYEYVIDKYNIDTNGLYIYGQSNGGLTAENIVELTNLPVIAYVLEVPSISMQYTQTQHAPNEMQQLYGFNSVSTYDTSKCMGLDAFRRNMSEVIEIPGNNNEQFKEFDIDSVTAIKFRKNIPVLITRSASDTTVSPEVIGAYAMAIRNGNGNCKLITYTAEDIGHRVLATTPVVGKIAGINVTSAILNVIRYFESNGGYLSEINN